MTLPDYTQTSDDEKNQVDFNEPLMEAIFTSAKDWKAEIKDALQYEGVKNLNTVVIQSKIVAADYGTLLHSAIAEEKENRVAFILDNYGQYIDYSLRDSEGKTLLLIAAKAMRPYLVKKILENAKKKYSQSEFQKIIDTPDIQGRTPLHIACVGTPRIAKLLLDNHASLDKEDLFGRTPLDCTYASEQEIAEQVREISIDPFRHIRATGDSLDKGGYPYGFKLMLNDEQKPLSSEKEIEIVVQGGKDVRVLLKYFKVCCSHADIVKHHAQNAPAPYVHCRYGNISLLLTANIKGLYQKGFKYGGIERIVTLFYLTANKEITQQDLTDLYKIGSYFKFLAINKRDIEMFEEQNREQYLELFQTWLNHLKTIIPILKKYIVLGKEIAHLDKDIKIKRSYIDNFLVKCNDFEILLTWYNKMEPWLDVIANCRRGQILVRELLFTHLKSSESDQDDDAPTETRTACRLSVLPSSTSFFCPTAIPKTAASSTSILSSSRIMSSCSSVESYSASRTASSNTITVACTTPSVHSMQKEKSTTLCKRRLNEFADSEHYTATGVSEKREKFSVSLGSSSSSSSSSHLSDKPPSTSSSSSSSSRPPFSLSTSATQQPAVISNSSTTSGDLTKSKKPSEPDSSECNHHSIP